MFKHMLVWFVPAALLILSLFPVYLTIFFPLVLQIIVSLAAAYISYLLFIEKPRYYLFWGIAFIIIVLIFNPIIHLSVMMGFDIPLALVAAIIFLTNWWFVFKTK
jgi:hypothetical protein